MTRELPDTRSLGVHPSGAILIPDNAPEPGLRHDALRSFDLEVESPDVLVDLIAAHLLETFPDATSFVYQDEVAIGYGESVPEHLQPHKGKIIKDSVVVIDDQAMDFELKRGKDHQTQGVLLRDEGVPYMTGQAGGGLVAKRLETKRDGKITIGLYDNATEDAVLRVDIAGENLGVAITAVSSFLKGMKAGQQAKS